MLLFVATQAWYCNVLPTCQRQETAVEIVALVTPNTTVASFCTQQLSHAKTNLQALTKHTHSDRMTPPYNFYLLQYNSSINTQNVFLLAVMLVT